MDFLGRIHVLQVRSEYLRVLVRNPGSRAQLLADPVSKPKAAESLDSLPRCELRSVAACFSQSFSGLIPTNASDAIGSLECGTTARPSDSCSRPNGNQMRKPTGAAPDRMSQERAIFGNTVGNSLAATPNQRASSASRGPQHRPLPGATRHCGDSRRIGRPDQRRRDHATVGQRDHHGSGIGA